MKKECKYAKFIAIITGISFLKGYYVSLNGPLIS